MNLPNLVDIPELRRSYDPEVWEAEQARLQREPPSPSWADVKDDDEMLDGEETGAGEPSASSSQQRFASDTAVSEQP
eukprot:9481551-Karenia_brevis.AAC.1